MTATAISAGDSPLLRFDSVSDDEPDPEPEPEPELELEPGAPAPPVAVEVGTTEIAVPLASDAVVRKLADFVLLVVSELADETVTETPPVDN